MSVFEYIQPMSSVYPCIYTCMEEKVSIFRYGSVIFFYVGLEEKKIGLKLLTFPIDLAPNRIPLGVKYIWEV